MREATLAGYDPGPVEIGDLDGLLSRLRITGDVLQPVEILELKALLSISTQARASLDRAEVAARFPDLKELGARFGDFRAIVRRCDEVFDPGGEFLDTASPELARIRHRLRLARTEAGEALSSLARREASNPEETFVTLRDGRYVLAVRTHDRARLAGIVHGHSGSGQTVFLEPFQAVERNNEISGLESHEQEERIRILRELTDWIQGETDRIEASYHAAIDLDLLRARARLALDLDCTIPAFNDGERVHLVAARHPLLAASERAGGGHVVPLDLDLPGDHRTLVLSGPNMGGKTVALKTVGLIVAMAQAGLLVPAGDGTEVPVVDGIFADLGDEQSIEQETSTFSGHLRNIALAWDGATSHSLVLLDELGGGTDPDEGTAIGRALLELLTERGCLLLVTTHLSGLKMVAHEHGGMMNAAMEFDPSTQKPTYRMRAGSPGRSRAFELARRMLLKGELISRAESYRTPLSAQLDDLLGDIERRKQELDEELARVRSLEEDLRQAAGRKDKQVERLRQRIHSIREARWETTGAAIREAETLLGEARRIRAEMEQARTKEGRLPPVGSGIDDIRHSAESKIEEVRRKLQRPAGPGLPPLGALDAREGVRAYSIDLQSSVVIESSPDMAGKVWVSNGVIRFHVPLTSLTHPAAGAEAGTRPRGRGAVRGPQEAVSVERQIDVRGRSAEEALEAVERYVDRASIAGGAEIRIIHGKGTGILKREIVEFLRSSPLVEEFRIGEPREGGWGATIVRVRSAQVGG
jgi:DNA mismatch repair protein MutS2